MNNKGNDIYIYIICTKQTSTKRPEERDLAKINIGEKKRKMTAN